MGRIHKATSGYYYVRTENGETIECRGRGVFRKRGDTPLVGDLVEVKLSPDGSGTVTAIFPRKNSLLRPPLANLDRMVLVFSVADPAPNLFVSDKYLALLEHRNISILIVVTKADLQDADPLVKLYSGAGYHVCVIADGIGAQAAASELAAKLRDGVSAFCGNSGVGKSTLLNRIDPRLALPTGDTSKKLGRGRHTTRHVELVELPEGGLVADTPGFSSVEMLQMGHIPKEELAECFREFLPYLGGCRFHDCTHTAETGCKILEAVQDGLIAASRHRSYLRLYAEAREVREWKTKAP